MELSTDVISDMRDVASFSLPTPAIHLRDKNDPIKISLILPGRPSFPERYVISGFPRVIMTEDRVLGELNNFKTGTRAPANLSPSRTHPKSFFRRHTICL
jgi:hypothetical protein